MAKRPIFIPRKRGPQLVVAMPIEFVWHPGLSKTQKQKSIRSLHESAKKSRGIGKILEVSSKSEDQLGVQLSAFNLILSSGGFSAAVEVFFQGSKVFSNGGPFTDIYKMTSREAKKDERLRGSGKLVAFQYDKREWPLNPQTVFYDWLYLSALRQNAKLAERLLEFDGFSDIEFNPEKSINCQAASAALYKALTERDLIDVALASPDEFIRIHESQNKKKVLIQEELF